MPARFHLDPQREENGRLGNSLGFQSEQSHPDYSLFGRDCTRFCKCRPL